MSIEKPKIRQGLTVFLSGIEFYGFKDESISINL